jgi:hypothetical protein
MIDRRLPSSGNITPPRLFRGAWPKGHNAFPIGRGRLLAGYPEWFKAAPPMRFELRRLLAT